MEWFLITLILVVVGVAGGIYLQKKFNILK